MNFKLCENPIFKRLDNRSSILNKPLNSLKKTRLAKLTFAIANKPASDESRETSYADL
jgi:hypothetical protein